MMVLSYFGESFGNSKKTILGKKITVAIFYGMFVGQQQDPGNLHLSYAWCIYAA
jgi:hypothetical protein